MSNTQDVKNSFDLVIESIINSKTKINPKEKKSCLLLNHFIKRNLTQFNLKNTCVEDVISEVYLRGVKLINSEAEEEEKIRNPGAWIRVTAHNVIREMHRQKQKEQPNSELVELQADPQANGNYQEKEESFLKLKRLLKSLNEKDRQILELRFFHDLSWQEITDYLASQGEILTVATLRQRGSRALKRLRKAYLADPET